MDHHFKLFLLPRDAKLLTTIRATAIACSSILISCFTCNKLLQKPKILTTHYGLDCANYCQWRSKGRGGASGGTRPGAKALGAHQHAFCSHLKTRLKLAYFLEKL